MIQVYIQLYLNIFKHESSHTNVMDRLKDNIQGDRKKNHIS